MNLHSGLWARAQPQPSHPKAHGCHVPQNLCLSPWHSLCSTDPAFPVQSHVSAGSWQGREHTQVRILQGGFPKRGSGEGEGKGDWSTEKVPRSGTAPKPGGKRITTGSWKPEGGGKGHPQLCPSEDTQGGARGWHTRTPCLVFLYSPAGTALGQRPPEASWQRSSIETVIQVASGARKGSSGILPRCSALWQGTQPVPAPWGYRKGGAHAAAAALRGSLWATEQTK